MSMSIFVSDPVSLYPNLSASTFSVRAVLNFTSMLRWSRLLGPRGVALHKRPLNACDLQVYLRRTYWPVPRSRYKKLKPSILVEDEHTSNDIANHLADFKHYLKTTEIPRKLRMGLLRLKLSQIINEVDDYSEYPDMIPTVNAAILHLNRTHSSSEEYISDEDLASLFLKTAKSLASSKSQHIPEFMITLSQHFLETRAEVADEILLQIILLGSSLRFGEFLSVLEFIVKKRGALLLRSFTRTVLQCFAQRTELDLNKFESFLSVSQSQKCQSLLNDAFCDELITYIEFLFEERNPRVHEYKDTNKNVYRIQSVVYKLIECGYDGFTLETQLKLLKLKSDLNSVVATDIDILQVQKMLTKINAREKDSDFMDLKTVLFKQNLQDEDLAESLITELAREKEVFESMRQAVCDFVVGDEIKFSGSLRLKSDILKIIGELNGKPDHELFSRLQDVYSPYIESGEDLSESFTSIVQILMLTGITEPKSICMDLLTKEFLDSVDIPILAYKYILDRCIELEDSTIGFEVFEKSAKVVHWDQCTDPRVARTLNHLIVSLCEKKEGVTDIFPKFRKIKQHMTTQASAEAVNALAVKMLAEECVGDTIELLKRELPTIDKESLVKLQVYPSWAYAYRNLFQTMHNFVITYRGEETHETNWILYGELHKYFHVPYETYLPTLKFFCEVDRLNAALVIFRQVKRLNELHGNNNYNLPPLREMYMFLLQTFGDSLYEEGVVEIHEYLNMDVHMMEQDIDLQNCILNAYSNLQNVGKARDLFLLISSNAKENGGINEESVQIMIKTYTYSDMLYVKKFWNNLSQFGILPDYKIYKQYLIAHVYHGLVDDAFTLVEGIDDFNVEFSSDLLLAMHNYCLDLNKQKEIADWAQKNHKEEWEQLVLSGLLTTSNNYMPEKNLLVGKTA